MLHPGTLFIFLFVGLAPIVPILVMWRGVRRAIRDVDRRRRIVIAMVIALAVWAMATYVMFDLIFGTAWGVAHMRPIPPGMFPEGATVYVFLAAYAGLGAALVVSLGRAATRFTTRRR